MNLRDETRRQIHDDFARLRSETRAVAPDSWWLKQTELTTLGYEGIMAEIAERLRGSSPESHQRVLDWGGGPGFLSFLLEQLGIESTYFDLEHDFPSYKHVLSLLKADIHFADDPVKLPFEDGSFDAVISCGVLEHVPDPVGSLAELNRVLKPGGLLFIYHFPNRWSYTEALAGLLGRNTHDTRWTKARLLGTVRSAGFSIERFDFRYMVPRNLIGMGALNRFVSKHAKGIYRADHMVSRIPGLNRIANALNLIAVKNED